MAVRRLRGLQPSWTAFASAAARLFGCQVQADPATARSWTRQPDLLTDAASGSGTNALRAAGRRLVADAAAAWQSAGGLTRRDHGYADLIGCTLTSMSLKSSSSAFRVCDLAAGRGLKGSSTATALQPLLLQHPRSGARDALEGANSTSWQLLHSMQCSNACTLLPQSFPDPHPSPVTMQASQSVYTIHVYI